MKKVFCDICKKEIDTVYSELIVNNKIIFEMCHDCSFHVIAKARNLKYSYENTKTGDESH